MDADATSRVLNELVCSSQEETLSHPLLNELRGLVCRLKDARQPVTDGQDHLIPLCETIEAILRHGLKYPNSWFGLNKQDYWSWIEPLQDYYFNQKENPLMRQLVKTIASSEKCCTVVSKGRCFIRVGLCHKLISVPIEHLVQNRRLTQYWYSNDSIVADPALRKELMGLLFTLTEIDFQLSLDSSSFLDETWVIPTYKALSLPPLKTLSLKLSYVDKRALIVEIEKDCLAEKAGVEVGDALDELCGCTVQGSSHGKLKQILVSNSVNSTDFVIIKKHLPDGTLFRPILQCQLVSDERAMQNNEVIRNTYRRRPSLHIKTNGTSTEYVFTFLGEDVNRLNSGVEPSQESVDETISRVLTSASKPLRVLISVSHTGVSLLYADSRQLLHEFAYCHVCSCGRGGIHQTCVVLLATSEPGAQTVSAYVMEAPSSEMAQALSAHIAKGFSYSQSIKDNKEL